MNKVILDASAILAFLHEETGHAMVEKVFPNILVSAVNLAEVGQVLARNQLPLHDVKTILDTFKVYVVDFDHDLAFLASGLTLETRKWGLSFGDRACLSLGLRENLPILTANKAWSKIKDLGIRIQIIR